MMGHARRLGRYLARYWRAQLVTLVATAAAAGSNLIIPLFFMLLIDRVIGAKEVELLLPLVAAFLGTLIAQTLFNVLRDVLFARVSQLILRDIRMELCHSILRWPHASLQRERVGQIMSRVLSDTYNIPDILSTIVVATVTDIVTLAVAIVILLSLNWRLSLIALACLPLFVGTYLAFRRRTNRAATQTQVANATLSEELQTAFASIKEIKANWAYRTQEARFRDRMEGFRKAALHQQTIGAISRATLALAGALAPFAVLWLGAWEVLSGRLTVGQLVAFNSLVAYLFGPSHRLAQLNINLQVALASAARIFEYLDRPQELDAGRRSYRIMHGSVRADGVHFSHVPGVQVLTGIDLELPAGSRTALVGPSGSGKSTLADLLLGLLKPTAGRILVDGQDIATIRLASLRLQMACVPQDPVLFRGTLRENIAFVKPGARDSEILSVMRLCGIDQFARLEDLVGERGVTLSLGQRQRVGIARAILKRPAILILDEATCGLDPESEKQIWLSLSEWLAGSTILVITHRLLSVSDLERIHFLAQGRIIEDGTHEELMKLSGAYSAMFREQFRETASREEARPGYPGDRGTLACRFERPG